MKEFQRRYFCKKKKNAENITWKKYKRWSPDKYLICKGKWKSYNHYEERNDSRQIIRTRLKMRHPIISVLLLLIVPTPFKRGGRM